MSRIADMLRRQSEDLDALHDREVRRFLAALEDGRRHLREQLEAMRVSGSLDVQRFTAQHLRVALAQSEAGVRQLELRLGTVLGEQLRHQGEVASQNLLSVIAANEREFRDAGGQLQIAITNRLNAERGLLLHEHSIRRYGAQLVENIQRELVLGQTAGMTIRQVTNRIAATDTSVFSGMRYRAELIARMELNRGYNDQHQVSLEAAEAQLDTPGTADPLMKRIDEYFDKRNHPFSRVAHGTTAAVKAEFHVSVAEVDAEGAKLGKGSGGVVWRQVGGDYVGFNMPAHFNERGRQVPYRASWGPG